VKAVSRGIDRIAVTFDDPNLVANAGLPLVATLVNRLGLEDRCNDTIRLTGRVGGFRPGRKILTLVHAMVAGASHIDHADMLRTGSTATVLSHRVMAPSTLGTFQRVSRRDARPLVGEMLGQLLGKQGGRGTIWGFSDFWGIGRAQPRQWSR
jgi:hypothetical protein